MEETFQLGEIVWVKLKGYPWWPGMVRTIILSKNYTLCLSYIDKRNFIRTRIHSQVFCRIIRK